MCSEHLWKTPKKYTFPQGKKHPSQLPAKVLKNKGKKQ